PRSVSIPIPSVRGAAPTSTPDAPPVDEEPPYFLADDGSFETEVVLPDELLPPRRKPSSVAEPPRSFQAPPLVGRPLPSRPTYRNEKAEENPPTQNRDANDKTVSDSNADAPWLALSSKELAAAWLDATRGLGCILPTQAATFCSVATEAPNVFLVSFPASKRQEREYCEREKEKIGASLAQRLGAPASVRCLLDPSKTDADVLAPSDGRDSFRANRVGDGFSRSNGAEFGGRSSRSERRPDDAAPGVRDLYRQLVQNEAVVELRELFDAELTEIKPPRPSARRPAFPSPTVGDDSDDSDDD
ncbi:MAG: hypothetical protein IJO40_15465, partial [Thermoguttaceae bacterium]|nr:hypothetical protein [Thermoguttaceae bacterium]